MTALVTFYNIFKKQNFVDTPRLWIAASIIDIFLSVALMVLAFGGVQ